jgi:hypothetical protein
MKRYYVVDTGAVPYENTIMSSVLYNGINADIGYLWGDLSEDNPVEPFDSYEEAETAMKIELEYLNEGNDDMLYELKVVDENELIAYIL